MKRLTKIFAALATCSMLMGFIGCKDKKVSSNEIKLGLLCDITGDIAINGGITSSAMKFAVDEINAFDGRVFIEHHAPGVAERIDDHLFAGCVQRFD